MTYFLKGQKILTQDKYGGQLWISGLHFMNSQNLHRHHIQAVGSICQNEIKVPEGIIHRQWQIEDHQSQNVLEILKETNQFIDQMRKEGRNTLIHCIGGISRSGAVVMGYLMHKYGYGYDECEKIVAQIRPCLKLNKGFKNQFKGYEEGLKKAKL